MKTEVLLLTNPICFLPNYEKRSQGGQLSHFVHCPTVEPSCSNWCVLSPVHTAMEMTDGQSDNSQKKSHPELCETGRDGGGGVTASSGVAVPSTSCSGPGRNSVPKAATVIAAFYK